MRSKLICSLVSAAGGLVLAGDAHADVTRHRVVVDALPLADKPIQVEPKNAKLPNGARDHGPIPKTWRIHDSDGEQVENARCTDDRRASIATTYASMDTQAERIWEADGKTWLDTAEIGTAWMFVEVKRAERVPLGRIADGIWGYRRKDVVVLVAARDTGFVEEGGFYECRIASQEISTGGGTTMFVSSPKDVNDALDQIAKNAAEPEKAPKWHPAWVGVELRFFASVSRSSADASPMLNLVVKKP